MSHSSPTLTVHHPDNDDLLVFDFVQLDSAAHCEAHDAADIPAGAVRLCLRPQASEPTYSVCLAAIPAIIATNL